MKKTDLVNAVAKNIGITKKDASDVVESVFETIATTLANGEEVDIAKFGKFKLNERPAREGRNPLTGEPISIKASKALSFKASSVLKSAVKGE